MRSVLHDPHANAFNYGPSGEGMQGDTVSPPMTAAVHESKYELDSLANFLQHSARYYDAAGAEDGARCLGAAGGEWLAAVRLAMAVIKANQRSTAEEANKPLCRTTRAGPAAAAECVYSFKRETTTSTDTQMQNGLGVPAAKTGMSKTYFRPSDDAVTFPFNVPSNLMAVDALRAASRVVSALGDATLASDALALAAELDAGVDAFGMVPPPPGTASLSACNGGSIYAYEVDGFGSSYFMDDANMPSLLSLPIVAPEASSTPERAAALRCARAAALSSSNPYYFKGTAVEGIGGPHLGYGMVWPMSLVVQALTSDSEEEIGTALRAIVASSAGTGLLHESVGMNDLDTYSRSWFAWVNSLFGGLVLTLMDERPGLLEGLVL